MGEQFIITQWITLVWLPSYYSRETSIEKSMQRELIPYGKTLHCSILILYNNLYYVQKKCNPLYDTIRYDIENGNVGNHRYRDVFKYPNKFHINIGKSPLQMLYTDINAIAFASSSLPN